MSIEVGASNSYNNYPLPKTAQPVEDDEDLTLANSVKSLPSQLACVGVLSGGIYTVSNVPKMKCFGGAGFFDAYVKKSNELYNFVGKEKAGSYIEQFYAAQKRPLIDTVKSSCLSEKEQSRLIRKITNATPEELPQLDAKYGSLEKAAGSNSKISAGIKKFFSSAAKSQAYKDFSQSWFGKLFHRGGGLLFLGIEGTVETITEIIPAFKQKGLWGGLLQIGKSAFNIAFGIAGFILAEWAAAPLGAAIGARIGGALAVEVGRIIVGMGAGFIAGDQAKRLSKMIVGKNVAEKQPAGGLAEQFDGNTQIAFGNEQPTRRELSPEVERIMSKYAAQKANGGRNSNFFANA